MKEPNRFHDNLIYGYGDSGLTCSRPLDWSDPINSPRVYGRPSNMREIISWWGRLKAAWLVFSLNAFAVRMYDEKNAYQYGRCWSEWIRDRERRGRPAIVTCDPFVGGGVATKNESHLLGRHSP